MEEGLLTKATENIIAQRLAAMVIRNLQQCQSVQQSEVAQGINVHQIRRECNKHLPVCRLLHQCS
jgi:hypothetical protein